MSEQHVAIVNRDEDGSVKSRRYHLFEDCTMVEQDNQTNLTEREIELLGLSVCKPCVRRKEGGPALTAITELLTALDFYAAPDGDATETDARYMIDELKKRGFFISQRSKKDAE